MTYREAKNDAALRLEQAGIEFADNESWLLMEFACGMDRAHYLMKDRDPMPEEELARYQTIVEKRCTRYPLQYITGEQYFMGLRFEVNEHVLIPRQDTELLVEQAVQTAKRRGKTAKILDLCTGSGCIGISLKQYLPDAEVTCSDLSEEALTVAARNAKQNGLPVCFVHSDLFLNISEKYDMIVSNPPYIPSEVIPTLMPEVKDHEPVSALDGSPDGLAFYRRIIEEAPEHLEAGGSLLFEIGYDQGAAVMELMRDNFTDIEVIPDLAGLDRVVAGRRK